MARFYGSIQGSRGEASRLGGTGSGIRSSARGWNSGIDVHGFASNSDRDEFTVHVTRGSSGRSSGFPCVRVEELPGPVQRVTYYTPQGTVLAVFDDGQPVQVAVP